MAILPACNAVAGPLAARLLLETLDCSFLSIIWMQLSTIRSGASGFSKETVHSAIWTIGLEADQVCPMFVALNSAGDYSLFGSVMTSKPTHTANIYKPSPNAIC